jgi:hypothetical protein
MANLSKSQVAQIIQKAPPGLDPGRIVQALVEQGNTLEGFTPPSTTQPAFPSTQVSTQPSAPSQPQDNSFFGKVGRGITQGLGQAAQAGIGALKSIPAAADQFSQLGQRALGGITGVQAPTAALPKAITTPTNQDQKAGFLGGQIGQVIAGAPAIESAVGAASRAAAPAGKIASLGAKAATEGLIGSGIAKVQGASDQGAVGAGAIASALPLVGAGLKAASPALAAFLHLTTGGEAGTPALQEAFNNPEAVGQAIGVLKKGGPTEVLDKIQSAVPTFRKALTQSYQDEMPGVLQALGDTKITLPPTTIQDLIDAKQIAKKLDAGPLQTILDAQSGGMPITMSADTLARNAGKTLIPAAELSGEDALNLYHNVNDAISKYGLQSGADGVPLRDFRDTLRQALVDNSGGKGGVVDNFLKDYSNKKTALDLLESVVKAYQQGDAKAQQGALNSLRSAYSNGNEEITKAIHAFEETTNIPVSKYAAAMQFERILPSSAKGGSIMNLAKGLAGVTGTTSPRGAGLIMRTAGRVAKTINP